MYDSRVITNKLRGYVMPNAINKKTGEQRELGYDMGGIQEGQRLQAEDPNWQVVKTQRYQTGGLVHSSSSRELEMVRGTGVATRGLDFYKS